MEITILELVSTRLRKQIDFIIDIAKFTKILMVLWNLHESRQESAEKKIELKKANDEN